MRTWQRSRSITRYLPLLAFSTAMVWIASGCGSSDSHDMSVSAAEDRKDDSQISTQPESVAAAEWSRFRGAAGMGVSAAEELPTSWSAAENILWKAPLSGAGASSPIVFGDRVYLTSFTGYGVPGEPGGQLQDLQRHLLARSLADGSLIWDRAIPARLPEEEHIRDHGYAANTPIADTEMVYAFLGKSGVFAFDHDGQQRWQADVGTGTNGWGTAASPILHGDLLIVNASVESESVVALDRRTGKEVWRVKEVRESWNTPIVLSLPNGQTELVFASMGQIWGIDPATGTKLWNCATDITWYMVPSLVAHDDVVYAIGGRSGVTGLAVRAGGRGDVTASHRLWTTQKGSNVPSPIYHDGHLYWVNDSRAVAVCVNAATGEVVYEQRLERAGQFYASLLLGSDRIYALSRDGQCFVWAAKPKFEQLAMNDLRDGSIFDASLAVSGNRLLLRSDKNLYCIEAR